MARVYGGPLCSRAWYVAACGCLREVYWRNTNQHLELENESENGFFPKLPVLSCSATLIRNPFIRYFDLFNLDSWGEKKEDATLNVCHRHKEWFARSCRAIHPEGAWLDLDDAFRDALLYAPTLSCFWLTGESKRMHRLCRDMAVAPFPACCVPSPCHFIWGSTVETLAHVICPIYKLIKKINRRESTWQTLLGPFSVLSSAE